MAQDLTNRLGGAPAQTAPRGGFRRRILRINKRKSKTMRKTLGRVSEGHSMHQSTGLFVLFALIGFLPAKPVARAQAIQQDTKHVKSVGRIDIRLPALAKICLSALGDRLEKPGNERVTLAGTFTDANGSMPTRVTWQAPRSIRIDRNGQLGRSIIFSSNEAGSPPSLEPPDYAVLESLLDDSPEAFFYGFQQGAAYRLLGKMVRSDDGTTKAYNGPWYDVYEVSSAAAVRPGQSFRVKHYYFDSLTHLIVKTRSVTSASKTVTTGFENWTKTNGQYFPGKVTRTEDGVTVFTFSVASAVSGPFKIDGVFSQNSYSRQ